MLIGQLDKGRQLPDPAKSDRKYNLIFTVLAQNRLTRSAVEPSLTGDWLADIEYVGVD